MSFYHNPRVITDGLILCLDAENPKSYLSSGDMWYDLSGNKNHLTRINSPTFNNIHPKSFEFDNASTRFVTTGSTQLGQIGNSNHTIMVFLNNDSVSQSDDFIGTGAIVTGHVLLMIFSTPNGFRGHSWDSGNNSNVIDSPNTLTTGQWRCLTQVMDFDSDNEIKIYEETNLANSAGIVASKPSLSNAVFIVGHRSNTNHSNTFDGKIAYVAVYDRVLSPLEIETNYIAIKGRFEK